MRKASDEEINSVLSVAPIENILMSAYDEFVEENARIRAEAGLKELIIREAVGGCCEWCSKLAGIFEYGEHPKDVFRRHDNCTCLVTHKSEKAYTNVHSKKVYESQRDARIDSVRTREILEKTMHHDKIEQRRKAEDYVAGETLAMRRLREKYATDSNLEDSQKERIRKILAGEFPLKQRQQKFLQHSEGTAQNKSAIDGRGKPQSILTISEEDAQAIILQYAGTGTSHTNPTKAVTDEFVDMDDVIGYYYEKEEAPPIATKRLLIKYSKKGTHIIPVEEK